MSESVPRNDKHMVGVLHTDRIMTPEEIKEFRAQWNEQMRGCSLVIAPHDTELTIIEQMQSETLQIRDPGGG